MMNICIRCYLKINTYTTFLKYMNVIRYHSFYPWHTSGEYRHLMKSSDYEILEAVNEFNEYDLYSKEDSTFISDEVKDYYDTYLDKYFPTIMQW